MTGKQKKTHTMIYDGVKGITKDFVNGIAEEIDEIIAEKKH